MICNHSLHTLAVHTKCIVQSSQARPKAEKETTTPPQVLRCENFHACRESESSVLGLPPRGRLSGERTLNIGFQTHTHTHAASENLKPSPTILAVYAQTTHLISTTDVAIKLKKHAQIQSKNVQPILLVFLTVKNSESLHDCSIFCVIMWPEISAVLSNAFSQCTAKTGTYCSTHSPSP